MAVNNHNLLTKEGKIQLEKELKELINVSRPQIIKQIQEAREHGDLSENADYDSAKNEQAKIEGRIQEIEGILSSSKLISESSAKDNIIRIRSKILYIDLDDNKEYECEIVGTIEADPSSGKISNESPMAKAILGKTIGDQCEVRGIEEPYKIKILKVWK
ncbi:MAG: transcription elongation factor GreA [Mycoplasmoidaceae bacterium]